MSLAIRNLRISLAIQRYYYGLKFNISAPLVSTYNLAYAADLNTLNSLCHKVICISRKVNKEIRQTKKKEQK